jgi:hypothetical protein
VVAVSFEYDQLNATEPLPAEAVKLMAPQALDVAPANNNPPIQILRSIVISYP